MPTGNHPELDDVRIRHLELIQTLVTRMDNNSFLIKGWSLTVFGAMLAYAVGGEHDSVVLVSFVPVLAFWLLDAYFHYQQRLFRRLYERVRRSDAEVEPFALDVTPGRERTGLLKAAVSPSLSLFYGGLALSQAATLVFVL
ncbi:hypothetical protein ACFUIW_02620 [Streptomyces sp. NPDC057245]|uniref:hypothetical protein n=1 Tax=Streptomyces TaxID=1883 RepID=UPI001C1E6918|nr:hypothetical protein [Streptomyces sp. A108]MBU6535841.1 hypothetical protein [Streptomyces sp. A108]